MSLLKHKNYFTCPYQLSSLASSQQLSFYFSEDPQKHVIQLCFFWRSWLSWTRIIPFKTSYFLSKEFLIWPLWSCRLLSQYLLKRILLKKILRKHLSILHLIQWIWFNSVSLRQKIQISRYRLRQNVYQVPLHFFRRCRHYSKVILQQPLE